MGSSKQARTVRSDENAFPLRAGREPEQLVLDPDTLGGFGTLRVPLHLWRALSRFAAWIEPALLTEWQLLMEDYAARQDRSLVPGMLARALRSSARLLHARAGAIQRGGRRAT